jgi:hypothetical protein
VLPCPGVLPLARFQSCKKRTILQSMLAGRLGAFASMTSLFAHATWPRIMLKQEPHDSKSLSRKTCNNIIKLSKGRGTPVASNQLPDHTPPKFCKYDYEKKMWSPSSDWPQRLQETLAGSCLVLIWMSLKCSTVPFESLA